MWQVFTRKKNSKQLSPKVSSNIRKPCPVDPMISCAPGLTPHVWAATFQRRKQEVPQIKGFCLLQAEEDLHSGTARKPVLFHPKDSISWRADTCSFPRWWTVCQVERERHVAKFTTELHLRRMRILWGKKGARGKWGESPGRRRKTKTTAQSQEVSRLYKTYVERQKGKDRHREKLINTHLWQRSAKSDMMVDQHSTIKPG